MTTETEKLAWSFFIAQFPECRNMGREGQVCILLPRRKFAERCLTYFSFLQQRVHNIFLDHVNIYISNWNHRPVSTNQERRVLNHQELGSLSLSCSGSIPSWGLRLLILLESTTLKSLGASSPTSHLGSLTVASHIILLKSLPIHGRLTILGHKVKRMPYIYNVKNFFSLSDVGYHRLPSQLEVLSSIHNVQLIPEMQH